VLPFNFPNLLLPGLQLPIKFTEKSDFDVLRDKNYAKSVFKFVEATVLVIHMRSSSSIYLAHAKDFVNVNADYDITKFFLKHSHLSLCLSPLALIMLSSDKF
jgi:hypothetical protein